MSETSEIWYRYIDVAYAPMADEFGDRRGEGSIEIQLREYKVVRRTPKGVWLISWFGDFNMIGDSERFVLNSAHKRFACPTKQEAIDSFIARKRRQLGIYQARARAAQRALDKAKELNVGPACYG